MPMAHSPQDSGSEKYCSYCFENGLLKAEGQTLKEFQKKCYEGMRGHGAGHIKAWLFSKMIMFAPYWKNKRQILWVKK